MKPKHYKVIIGNDKHNDVVEIKQIDSEKENVTICAKLLDVDIFDSDKTDITLITLITEDNTGIMYSEIYFKDIESCKRVYNLFRVNSWYKITGDSFYNKYFDRIMIKAKHISEVGNSYIEE